MIKFFCLLISITFFHLCSAQMVAEMQIKEPIEGLCHPKKVYVLLSMFGGQKEAVCPVSAASIQTRLNAEVTFLKDSINYNDEGMVDIIINCKGEVVKCEIDNKTKYPELDQQIVAVFKSLGNWMPGKLNGDKINSSKLWSFKILNGKITIQ